MPSYSGCSSATRQERSAGFASIHPLDGWTPSTKAGGESHDSPQARALLAGRTAHIVATLTQHRAGRVVGDDQWCLGEEGEEEQFAGVRQRKRLAGALPACIPLGMNPAPSAGDYT